MSEDKKVSVSVLDRLIAEGIALAGGIHRCDIMGHEWVQRGARPCPFHEDGCGDRDTSQPVFVCSFCDEIDYGNFPGYPGYEECKSHGFNCGELD